jgi:hypothetical protein
MRSGYRCVHAGPSPRPPARRTELYGSTEKQLAQTARRGYRETALGTPQGGFPHRGKQSDRIAKVDVEGSSPFTRSSDPWRRLTLGVFAWRLQSRRQA